MLALVPWGARCLYETSAVVHVACPPRMGSEPPCAIKHLAVIGLGGLRTLVTIVRRCSAVRDYISKEVQQLVRELRPHGRKCSVPRRIRLIDPLLAGCRGPWFSCGNRGWCALGGRRQLRWIHRRSRRDRRLFGMGLDVNEESVPRIFPRDAQSGCSLSRLTIRGIGEQGPACRIAVARASVVSFRSLRIDAFRGGTPLGIEDSNRELRWRSGLTPLKGCW